MLLFPDLPAKSNVCFKISLLSLSKVIFSYLLELVWTYLAISGCNLAADIPYILKSFRETPLASFTKANNRCSGDTFKQPITPASR